MDAPCRTKQATLAGTDRLPRALDLPIEPKFILALQLESAKAMSGQASTPAAHPSKN
jgi:hypothetical protein